MNRLVVVAHDAGAAAEADWLANGEVGAIRVAVREKNVSLEKLGGRKQKRTSWDCS